MKKSLLLSVVALALLFVGTAYAEDGDAKEGSRWTLGLEHGSLKIVAVRQASGRVETYQYITLEVTNGTPLPRDWYPTVKALTDTGRVYEAMGYEEALPAIRHQERNDDLVSIGMTKGKIQPGEVLDAVAIFGPLDPEYDRIRIQLLGLADPIAIYKLDRYPVDVEVPGVVYKQATGDGSFEDITQAIVIQDVAYVERNKKTLAALRKEVGDGDLPEPTAEYWEISERRVFEMVYLRPGDEFRPDDDLISFERSHWRVVGAVKALRQIKM